MTTFPLRTCPVCQNKSAEALFRQEFASYSDGGLMSGYDIAVCASCGAGYADGIPTQSEFDRYYAEMSKYEHSYREGKVSDVDSSRFREIVDMASPYVKLDDRIVDVGCATGALLAEFKRRGYTNLQGYDPSVSCAEAAKRLYGINIAVTAINGLKSHQESADLVMMTGVLEHLADVDTSLNLLKEMLAEGGMLYLEVPDASRYNEWFSAPYQFFSMEHVNFFSPQSLSNLLARHGFALIFVERVKRFIGAKSVEPGIAGLFKFTGSAMNILPDKETAQRLKNYILKSEELELSVHKKVASLVKSQEPVAVWGVGTHTLRLLQKSNLKDANIAAFLDSNSRYHGKIINGTVIEDPEKFLRPEVTILISSHMVQEEIRDTIMNKLGWENQIICLYEGAPIDSKV